jgi:hypothetical protein
MAAGDVRKRSRTFEPSYDGAADDEGHSKGGHSLRKRARIDYTQEMIEDDLGLPTARNDLVVKQASTPSSRGRKRKGGHDDSGDESEDTASNPKRSRLEKSPAPFRASAARRRNTSKKLSTDLSNIVDQPSDNEVQDTILVSVPTGPGASSEEGSDQAISDDMILDQPYASPEMAHAHLSLTPPSPEIEEHELAFENETPNMGLVAPTITNEPETTTPQDSEVQITEAGRVNQSFQHLKTEASQQTPATEPSIEISRPATTPVPESKLPVDTTAPEPLQDTLKPSTSPSSSRQESKPTGPARLKPLARIYNSETPFASRVKLTPYEDEDTTLPGPYTEWVYPTQTVKEEWFVVPTATPCNTPLERKPVEAEWDMRRPLKTKEFFALYRKEKKRRQEKGEPAISLAEFNNECARRYRSAHALDPISATPSSTTSSSTVAPEKPTLPAIASTTEETPQGSQLADSRLPTAAPSPAAADDDTPPQEDAGEDEAYADEAIQEQLKPTSPGAPVEVARNPRKQYLFPKIRDPNEFAEAFEGWQDFDTDRLYETVAAAVETLHAYQQEYHELKKLLDDEENAKRRQASDKTLVNWENRQKADEPLIPRRHFDDVVKGPAAFEVRGARAPKPYIDDPVLERQKEEDRVMAQAYGFKLNTHPTQVGRQNPEEQRWEMPENRLRKRTEKGAELAEENVVEGKRARKPRHVADQSRNPSRAGTPTGIAGFGPVRRQRRKAVGNTNGDEFEGSEQVQFAESFSESPRKGRAARARALMLLDEQDPILPVAEADNNRTEDEEVEVDEKPKVPRRRGRAAANHLEPPTSVPSGFGGDVSKPKRVRGVKGQQGNHHTGPEIASSSFYSNMSTQPGSRPSTASSDDTSHTAETTESTYSLRDKRKRNFALENDPELETRPQRRGRGPAAPKQEAAEPKKRGPKKKEPAAQPPPPPPASIQSHAPRPASPPPLQQPLATKFYNNFVTGPMMVENGSQPVPSPAGPFLHTFNAAPAFLNGTPPPPPQPPSVKKPITKIKFTNHGPPSEVPSSRASTPANGSTSSKSGKRSRTKKASVTNEAQAGAAANGDGDLDKPYAEMTKSEKMSWSMRSK